MSNIDYNQRAARGQAFNLAVADAIQEGEKNNPKYIYTRYIYYLTMGDILQSNDLELIQEALEDKKLDKLIQKFKEYFEEL